MNNVLKQEILPSIDDKQVSPLASIVVLAYNHLDYTKQCIESIYRYTSHIDFELITINNGSKDGTEEYFNSLPNTKKISFKENIGVCKAINYGIRVSEGKYILNISNDIVVTAKWLDNLLICMETMPEIGMVVPVCNASCNYQQINLPCDRMDEIQKFAENYNISNPNKWDERMKLSTYAGIYRSEIMKTLGGFDEDFNPGCYDDDAICFSIRRMGYKVILAKDTFVHHYGAKTFNEEYDKDKTLQIRNKLIFMSKFGADPYICGLIDYNVINLLKFSKNTDNINILGIGKSYGTTMLELKNECRHHDNKNVTLDYLSEEEKAMKDLKTICNKCISGFIDNVQDYFGGTLYDYIVLESESHSIQNIESFFVTLYNLLKPGGQIVCTAANQEIFKKVTDIFSDLGADFVNQINNYYLCFSKPKTLTASKY